MIPKSPQFHERHDGHDQMQPDISLVSHKSPEIIKKSPEIIKKSPEIIEKSPEIIKKSPEIIKKSPEIIKKSPEIIKKSPEIIKQSPEIIKQSPEIIKKSPEIIKKSPEIIINPHESQHIPMSLHDSPHLFSQKKSCFFRLLKLLLPILQPQSVLHRSLHQIYARSKSAEPGS